MLPEPEQQFNKWILLQIADSALPVGGFVASFGLEAALQLGSFDFNQFLQDSIQTVSYSSLPIVETTMKCLGTVSSGNATDCRIDKLIEIDREFEAFIGTNHVNSRASVMQGIAYLTLISKSFSECKDIAIVNKFKILVRKKAAFGHFTVAFGIACHCLGIEIAEAEFLFLFMHVRMIVSSAIRLGIIGPYTGQSVIFNAKTTVQNIISEYRSQARLPRAPVQTSPLLEIIQCSHDKLYTRIFNS